MGLSERTAAWASVLPGLVLSAMLAPKDAAFLPNFMFYALSQLIVLGLIAATMPRPAVLAGAAVALSLYFGAYAAWLLSRTPVESMAWLGYLFTLPGAVVAVLGVRMWPRGLSGMSARAAMLAAAVAALAGLALGQVAVCSTVMHCSL
jgi:hypothetical protein